MSQQALDLIAIAKKNRATRLDIGNCNLTELPEELFELTWLEELIVSNMWFEYSFDIKEGKWLNSQNNGEANNLKFISPKIKLLRGLKKLIICGKYDIKWELSDLTPLTNLTALQYLDVSDTQVSNLTPLTNLTALQYLYVSGKQVSDLTPLTNLTALQILSVPSTQVSDLTPLTNLTALQQLNVSYTLVSDLSPLKNLMTLQLLYVDSTQVSDLSPLKDLKALLYLGISSTQVSDLCPLKSLTTLEELHVSSTQVSDLSSLMNLTALQLLHVDSTQVSDLSPLKKIIEKGVPVKWHILEKGIMVHSCPLTNPPREIVEQGNEAILRYWQEQERVGKSKVNEARLLIVGQGASGKTTLKDKLKDPHAAMPEPDATTRGIDIEPLKCTTRAGEDFTVQVWDFGGQNIQKYAHQFFMSDSVVYAVLSNTREQNQNFQYWLNIIELLGKDSPFFIVQNEKDGHVEALKDISQIQERFPQTFKSVEHVNLKDAATDPRFEALRLKLFDAATQLPHTQKEYLVSFVNVRQQLDTLSATEQTLPFKQFKQLCKAEGIEDPELMNDYARTFTLLGIALHFEDDIHLSSQVFLRPKWIIDALFAVLYADIVEHQQGKFSAADAKRIWQADMYDDMHGVLLQLMVKFHLCYAIPHTTDYIVPQRLPTRAQEDAFVPPPDATHLLYRYKFLPSGLLTQLTCRLHERIEGAKVWNDAVQFSTKNGQGHVFVRENSADNQLELFGFGKDKADLINTVLGYMDEIHQNSKFGNLKVEKLVPCPCAVCASKRAQQDDAFFFEYDILIQDLREGETESDKCKFSRKRSPIRSILKNAEIRLVDIDKIRDLLAENKIDEAVKILRRVLPKDDEVIVQSQRFYLLNEQNRLGQLPPKEFNREQTIIINDIIATLRARENDF
jgi:internalin A